MSSNQPTLQHMQTLADYLGKQTGDVWEVEHKNYSYPMFVLSCLRGVISASGWDKAGYLTFSVAVPRIGDTGPQAFTPRTDERATTSAAIDRVCHKPQAVAKQLADRLGPTVTDFRERADAAIAARQRGINTQAALLDLAEQSGCEVRRPARDGYSGSIFAPPDSPHSYHVEVAAHGAVIVRHFAPERSEDLIDLLAILNTDREYRQGCAHIHRRAKS